MADFKYYGASYIYVDAGIGNDANAGTIAAPKQTIAAALTIANNSDTIIIGTGKYVYIEPASPPNDIKLIGDGFVLFDGTGEVSGNAIKDVSKIKNINFYNYNSGAFAIEFRTFATQNLLEVQNCNFYGCDFKNSRNSFDYIKDSIFQNCTFDLLITGQELQNAIHNCTFVSCSNQLGDASTMTYGVFNNTYTDCETFRHTVLAGAAPEAIAMNKFNYCNVDGDFMYGTQTELKALGTNLLGSSFTSSLVFNDYVDTGTRPIADWWKQSYTQKLTSPLLTIGRNGTHIGRYFKSHFFSAQTIYNTYLDNSNNIQLSTDVIEVNTSGLAAHYEGVDFPINNEKLSRLIVNNDNTYGASGEITEYIFQRDNIAPQQKSSINIGIATIDQIDATTFVPIDNYWYNGYGADLGGAPPYIGTSDTNYINIGLNFNGKISVKSTDINVRFELKTL